MFLIIGDKQRTRSQYQEVRFAGPGSEVRGQRGGREKPLASGVLIQMENSELDILHININAYNYIKAQITHFYIEPQIIYLFLLLRVKADPVYCRALTHACPGPCPGRASIQARSSFFWVSVSLSCSRFFLQSRNFRRARFACQPATKPAAKEIKMATCSVLSETSAMLTHLHTELHNLTTRVCVSLQPYCFTSHSPSAACTPAPSQTQPHSLHSAHYISDERVLHWCEKCKRV